MLKYYVIAVILLVASSGFSQNQHRRHFRIEGFSVKTDALALFNSILSNEQKSYYLSGEMYFNNEYSLNVDLGTESENQPGWKRNIKSIGSHFRWYFMQDDCSCSAFFVGGYFSYEKEHQSVDEKYLGTNARNYTMSSSEVGLSGGYQALVASHFVIDPAVHLGLKFPHDIHYAESMSKPANDEGLLLRISLGIGYRF